MRIVILDFQLSINAAPGSPFGPRGNGYHYGIDYPARVGTPVVASETGKVVRAAFNTGGFGNVIVIDHTPLAADAERHIYTLYAHLSFMGASAGETFRKGVTIGLSGESGSAKDDPHLHFEVIDSGTKMDWSSAKGPMGFGGIEGRQNPHHYFGKDYRSERHRGGRDTADGHGRGQEKVKVGGRYRPRPQESVRARGMVGREEHRLYRSGQ